MNVAGILLAAGASSRLGFPKQLLKIKGETLIRRAIRTLLASGCHPVVVVVGANAELILPEITDFAVTPVRNPDWQTGMAQSIHAGLTAAGHLEKHSQGALITLCDQPRITAADLIALIDLFTRAGKPIAAAFYRDTLGVPAIFDRSLFPELLALKGEAGARKVISAHRRDVASLPMAAAALDIDTQADLAPAGIILDAPDAFASPSKTPQ